MNIHVVVGTEQPQRLAFFDRPREGESVALPDGRTVVINKLVHDLNVGRFVAQCLIPVEKKSK